MRKVFENRTIYITDGNMLEEVREFLIANDEHWRMGYVAEEYKDIPASQGYLYPPAEEGEGWYISMKLKEGFELVTLEQIKQLEIDRLNQIIKWFNNFADAVQGNHRVYESACEYADEQEAKRYPELHADYTGTYCSIHDFIEENDLEERADELFGEGWEAEDDVEQIKQLAGNRHAVVVDVPMTEREKRRDDYIEVYLK